MSHDGIAGRGGMGFEGLLNLMKFVQEGGLLITEGSTSTIFPDYHLVSGVTIEEPTGLFARGVVMKSVFADRNSPIAYGYADNLSVYISNAATFGVTSGAGGRGGRGRSGLHPARHRDESERQQSGIRAQEGQLLCGRPGGKKVYC